MTYSSLDLNFEQLFLIKFSSTLAQAERMADVSWFLVAYWTFEYLVSQVSRVRVRIQPLIVLQKL